MSFGPRWRRGLIVMLTVVALTAQAAWAGAIDRPASAPVAQVWTSAAQADWGATALALAAGKDRTIRLDRGGQTGSRFVLQVESVAAKAGDLTLAAPGVDTDSAVAFPVGTAAATTLVTTDADGRVQLRSSVAVALRLTVVGHVSGAPGPAASAGDTVLVPASTMVDQATGAGGTVPTTGSSVVPVAALHGLPSAGARAVWLSVAARGERTGSVTFGSGSADSSVSFTSAWSTSLVLAPVDEDGAVRYSVSSPTTGLRVTVVGWVAGGAAAAAGALSVTPTSEVLGTAFTGTRSVRVVGGAVPEKVDKVLIQVGVRVSLIPGSLRVAASKAGLASGAGAPVPLLGRTTVTVLAPVASDGTVVVSVPPLAPSARWRCWATRLAGSPRVPTRSLRRS